MESALRGVDRGAAQTARSQLRVTLDSAKLVASEPMSFQPMRFWLQKPAHAAGPGVLLHELLTVSIACATEALMRNPKSAGRRIDLLWQVSDEVEGVRSNSETLADLMVTDLNEGSSALRAGLPDLLQPLVGDLLVMDDGEYRLQSPTDAEWNRAFRERRQAYPDQYSGTASGAWRTRSGTRFQSELADRQGQPGNHQHAA